MFLVVDEEWKVEKVTILNDRKAFERDNSVQNPTVSLSLVTFDYIAILR